MFEPRKCIKHAPVSQMDKDEVPITKQAMPRSHRAWRALLVLEITILLLSVPILGMVCYLIAFSNSSGNITVNVRNDQGVASDYTVAQLPTKLQMGPTWAFFANGLGGTIDSLLCIALLIGMKKTGFRQRWMHFVLLFVCFVSVVRSITAVGELRSSSSISEALADSSLQCTAGHKITVSSWTLACSRPMLCTRRQNRVRSRCMAGASKFRQSSWTVGCGRGSRGLAASRSLLER